MIRTFIDSGVLIYAARGEDTIAEVALQFIEDSERELASSIFLKLEVLPKSIFNKREQEIRFYESFFSAVSYWAMDIDLILRNAYREASEFGLGAMDALHKITAPVRMLNYFYLPKSMTAGEFNR